MLKITDNAIFLNKRRHGESGIIITVFCKQNGKLLGYARSWSNHAFYQSGMMVNINWQARNDQNLGNISIESSDGNYQQMLKCPQKAMVIQTICNYLSNLLPDHDPHLELYEMFLDCRDNLLNNQSPLRVLVDLERVLLSALGFGFDLSSCAKTGQKTELSFISPKTGRAVSLGAGLPYQHLLFTMPQFWINNKTIANDVDIDNALKITGYFLYQCLLRPRNLELPQTRQYLRWGQGRHHD